MRPASRRRHHCKYFSKFAFIAYAGWRRSVPHGVALTFCFGTYAAQVAEVSVEAGQVRVHKVTCVVDCGRAIVPDSVVAQMKGGQSSA